MLGAEVQIGDIHIWVEVHLVELAVVTIHVCPALVFSVCSCYNPGKCRRVALKMTVPLIVHFRIICQGDNARAAGTKFYFIIVH